MRMIFGVLSLLLALAVVGFLVKKQVPSITGTKLQNITSPDANSSAPSAAEGPSLGSTPSAAGQNAGLVGPMITSPNVQQQSQLIQQQVQQQLRAATEAALQQARPVQDAK